MNNKKIYWITIGISLLYIFLGNKFFTKDINFFEPTEYDSNFVQAEVTEVFDEEYDEDGYEDLKFKAKLLDKEHRGQEVTASQMFDISSLSYSNPVEVGDKILLYENIDVDGFVTWYADQPVRSDGIVVLGTIFFVLLLLFGRKQGVNTIVALIFTCLSIFVVFGVLIVSFTGKYSVL